MAKEIRTFFFFKNKLLYGSVPVWIYVKVLCLNVCQCMYVYICIWVNLCVDVFLSVHMCVFFTKAYKGKWKEKGYKRQWIVNVHKWTNQK